MPSRKPPGESGQVAAEPTEPALPQDVGQCHTIIQTLVRQVGQLQEQLDALKEKAGLNSRNSSKPPSSDGPQVGKRSRAGSARKRGGQQGHPGAYRQLVEADRLTDVVEVHVPQRCECGAQVRELGEPARHQVFDVPERVVPEISEYRLYRGVCAGCHRAHAAVLPQGVPRGQLGPRVLAAIGVLGTQYHLTQAKVQGVLRQFMGIEFSLGTISNAHGLVSQALKATVVSDRYAVYDYVPDGQHQVCWAHLVRDFTRMAQRAGQAGQIGAQLQKLAWAVFDWHKQGKSAKQYEPIQRRVKKWLEQASQGSCKRTARTANNLLRQWPTLWLFTTRAEVAPTNNAAERAIRALVLKRKISGPARSRRGLDFVAWGYSVVQSCALQGRDALSFITDSIRHWLGQAVPAAHLRPCAAPG